MHLITEQQLTTTNASYQSVYNIVNVPMFIGISAELLKSQTDGGSYV